jgi:hypothetical protein
MIRIPLFHAGTAAVEAPQPGRPCSVLFSALLFFAFPGLGHLTKFFIIWSD